MTTPITFNGYELPYVEDWSEDQDTRLATSPIQRLDGELIDARSNLAPRMISVKGKLWADTEAALRTLVNTLAYNLNQGRCELQLDTDRFIYATKDSFKKRFISGMAALGIEYQVDFFCDDPYWYALTATEQVETLTGAASQTINVTPAGLENTPCMLAVVPSGTLTQVKYTNTNALSQIWAQYDGSVSAADTLLINGIEKTCTNAGANELGNLTGDFVDLIGNQLNPLVITGTGHAGQLTITYRNRWL